MNILFVGGTFDDTGGKASGYMTKLSSAVHRIFQSQMKDGDSFVIQNGGNYNDLSAISCACDLLFWFPNIPNDKPKIVDNIKMSYPKMILVESKNNKQEKYTHFHLIARMLKHKTNLMIEFTGTRVTCASILDPLGNAFTMHDDNIDSVAVRLASRCIELLSFTRVKSVSIGGAIQCDDIPEFFKIVRERSDTFHELIHAANTSRFLGNISFRCESGFPSLRRGDLIFVSQRNVDKRQISAESMVAVLMTSTPDVRYYGHTKPSVDTPIQRLLYDYYPNVNYMLHSHVYVDGMMMTQNVIPCGAIEEFLEVISLNTNHESSDFCVNLKGHGSLVLANSLAYLNHVTYIARPFPEAQI